MTDEQEFVRDLILGMVAASGTNPTALARLAGVVPSTLTRFLKGNAKHTPSMKTLLKLSKVSGIAFAAGAPPASLSKAAKIEAVVAVAKALGVNLAEVSALAGDSLSPQLLDWLDIGRNMPPGVMDNALTALGEIAYPGGPAEHQPKPSKASRVRRKG